MNFLLSDEQLEMQRSVERFLAEQCDSTRLHDAFDGDAPFDAELWQGLCALGVAGIALPEEHGGLGVEMIDLAAVAEALGRHAAPAPFLGHALAGLALTQVDDAALRAHWLPLLAAGNKLATVALGEGSAWQPEQWQVALDAQGRISGTKTAVPVGDAADVIVVGVHTPQGARLALVERGAAGLTAQAQDGIDRTRRIATLQFDNTPAVLLAGSDAARLRDAALALLAADAFGGAARCLELAVDYAKVREQFGQPIGRFQGLKHQIVNMAIDVEPARGLYWHAAHAWDHLPDEAAASAARAKAHLGECFMQAARDAVEAHGGIGYTWEYDLQIFFKRAMFDHAWLGSPAEHRRRVAELAGW